MTEHGTTENKFYVGDSKISSAERDRLLKSPGTPANVMELARAAAKRHAEFYQWIKQRMSPDYARRVRELRCDAGWSYRTIAGIAYLELGADWLPINNQIAGVALCEAAAEHFGEDFQAWPWQAGQA